MEQPRQKDERSVEPLGAGDAGERQKRPTGADASVEIRRERSTRAACLCACPSSRENFCLRPKPRGVPVRDDIMTVPLHFFQ